MCHPTIGKKQEMLGRLNYCKMMKGRDVHVAPVLVRYHSAVVEEAVKKKILRFC